MAHKYGSAITVKYIAEGSDKPCLTTGFFIKQDEQGITLARTCYPGVKDGWDMMSDIVVIPMRRDVVK